jgi:biopolymer transport protein ExbD
MAKKTPELNASSMADIAFLLLIFFLVTTTMDVDSGISRKLPPPIDPANIVDVQVNERNVLKVLVNKNDMLLVDGKQADLRNLREDVKTFIKNPQRLETLPEFRTEDIPELGGEIKISKGIVSLKNDRGTSYDMYIRVQNELAAAFNELKDELSRTHFGTKYTELGNEDYIKAINKAIPVSISEAEPENVGD